MKTPTLRIKPYRHSATAPFVVEGLRINGKRVRKFFKTKKDAAAWLEQTKTKIANEGLSALTLGDDLRVMAVQCAGHALFGYAEDRGYCAFNPVAKTAKAKLIDKAPEIFTPQEAQALLEATLPDPTSDKDANPDVAQPWLGNADIIQSR